MKKFLLSIAALVIFFSATLITSCTKDDTDAPVITLLGTDPAVVTLGGTYTDAGATADDAQDGDLTSSIVSDYSATNPNVNLKGTYTITYNVSDADGNTGTAKRTVNVVNALENMAGSYSIGGTFDGAPDPDYVTDNVVTSSTVNNRIFFAKFVNYKDAIVYANISGNVITIPQQDVVCGKDNVSRRFTANGAVISASSFSLTGTVALTSAPNVTLQYSYTFTKN
mgnify:CR=1 FL=1